jgi:hypothetical protein
MKYTHDHNFVYAGKTKIAGTFYSIAKKQYYVAILQGMPRIETAKKIIEDCPDFAQAYNLKENEYPHIVPARTLKNKR